MGIRDRLLVIIAPEMLRKARELDTLEMVIRHRIENLPIDVAAECVKRHANGGHGWHCMKLGMPFPALMWAHEVHVDMARQKEAPDV